MNKIARWLLLLISCLILLPTLVASYQKDLISLTENEQNWLQQNHTVKVRVGNWPPFMFSDGEFRGISVDYIEKIFDIHEIKYQFVSDKKVPWKKALEYIKQHQVVDLLLTAKITDERKKFISFTGEYLFLPWVIFSRTDSSFIGGIDDLTGKTVCVPEGYVMHNLLKKNYPEIKLIVLSGASLEPRCIETLALGKVHAYIGNLAVGSYLAQNQGFNNIKVAAPVPSSFGNHNHAMAIRNDWPELTSIINKTLNTFSPEEHADIRNKWLSVRYEYGIRPLDIVKWVAGVTSVLVIIIAIIFFWNRKLSKEIEERMNAEKALRESENKYRGLSDAAFEGILITEDGRIIESNRTLAEMSAYQERELIGMMATDLVVPDHRKEVEEKILSDFEEAYETTALKKDGSTFPVEVRVKMVEYKNQKVRVSAVRDLTEQKKAAAEIHALRGILPICASCKKIRDDKGYWNQLEAYIENHSHAAFSHGICPECSDKHYGNEDWYIKLKKNREIK